MTYLEQLEIVEAIPIKEGDTIVIQCPFCGGLKKLAVSKLDGQLKWYCYRASCNAKGIYSGKRNLKAVKNYLADTVQKKTRDPKPIPEITTSVDNHQEALDYLVNVNSLEAYEKGYIKVRYAPSEDRVLFYADNGAVGRSLKSYGPKWITYGTIDTGVQIGKGETCVYVEDIPSACSVSRLNNYVGVALLGTNITQKIHKATKVYKMRILCLDKDASTKAINQLRNVDRSIKLRLLAKDLKELSKDQLIKVLNVY
tara:strand:- start:19902 stop:20666 length:765 start_codon:yes stop_codon:yes gene_type:complete